MTRKSLRGTHQGELFGVPPTGKPLSIEVIDILRVRDGKITDHWNLVDQLGLMRQLGAVPA
jgi:predicted ester cyclase